MNHFFQFWGKLWSLLSCPSVLSGESSQEIVLLRAEELKQNLGQDVIFPLPAVQTLVQTLWLVMRELPSSAASGIADYGAGWAGEEARSLQGGKRVIQLGFKAKSKVTSLVLKIRLSKQWSDHSIPIPVPTFFTASSSLTEWNELTSNGIVTHLNSHHWQRKINQNKCLWW